jgi:hypothetical protein
MRLMSRIPKKDPVDESPGAMERLGEELVAAAGRARRPCLSWIKG